MLVALGMAAMAVLGVGGSGSSLVVVVVPSPVVAAASPSMLGPERSSSLEDEARAEHGSVALLAEGLFANDGRSERGDAANAGCLTQFVAFVFVFGTRRGEDEWKRGWMDGWMWERVG